MLAAAGALLAGGAAFAALRLATPSDGSALDHRLVVTPYGAGVRALVVGGALGGLRDGDVIIAVDGVALEANATPPWALAVLPMPAEPVLRYDVVRYGLPLLVTVERGPYDLAAVLASQWSVLVFIAAMLAIGAAVFALRPDDASARAMLLFSAAMAASTPSFALGHQAPDLLGGPALLASLAGSVGYLLLWPGLFWFADAFAGLPGRWRTIRAVTAGAAVAAVILPVAVVVLADARGTPALRWRDDLATISDVFAVPFLVLVVAAFVAGYRASADERHRLRIRWVAASMGGAMVLGLVGVYLPQLLTGRPWIEWSAAGVLALPIPLTIGFAIVRHGAFDLRVAVNRSLVYGGLTVVIALVYVAVLTVAGSLLRDQAGLLASLLATGVVAVVAEPVRDGLQRAVNRLMYGDRDDPYAAIRRLGERLEAALTPDDLLPATAESIAHALRVPYVRLEIDARAGREMAAVGQPTEDVVALPLVHAGEHVGRLIVGRRSGAEVFSAADRALLDDLARHAASASHAVLLVLDLQDARRRLVNAREEERRTLRRQLHDEIGPALAGVGLKVEAARATLGTDASGVAILGKLRADVRGLVAEVRRIVDRLGPAGDAPPTPRASPAAALETVALSRPEDPPDAAAAPERPLDAVAVPRTRTGGRIVALLGLAVMSVALAVALTRFARPGDGWSLTPDAAGWGPQWQLVFAQRLRGDATALRPGDRLEAINGTPVTAILADVHALQATRIEDWASDQVVTYTVLRDEARLDVPVPIQSSSPLDVATAFVGSLVANAGFVLLFLISAFVLRRRPDRTAARLLWLFAVVAVSGLIVETVGGVAPTTADLLDPLSFWSFQVLSGAVWAVVIAPLVGHLFLAFPRPAGLLQSRPRLVHTVLYGGGLVVLAVPLVAAGGRLGEAWRLFVPVSSVWMLPIVTLAVARLVVAASRERDPEARAQARWVAWGALVSMGLAVLSGVLWYAGLVDGSTMLDAVRIYFVALPLSLAVAIVHHRLFDIDVVLNRTLVFGSLTAIVVVLYVGVVTVLGQLVAGAFAVSLVATAVVALLVHPLRVRLQRGVNRLLYGQRDEPYVVVSRLGQRIEASVHPEDLPPVVAETVAQALRLPSVAIEVDGPLGRRQAARVGRPTADLVRLPLVFQGAPIGELVVSPRAVGETFGPADRTLLIEIARQTSRVVHALELRRALAASQSALLEARAEERRRIRRDLHDDLGPALAAMAVTLEAAELLAASDSTRADALLGELQHEIRQAVAEIRRIVNDLRPPALDELGLVGAIRQQAARLEAGAGLEHAPPSIVVEAPSGLPALPAAVEVAAYRIVLEAVTNAVRHASATRCRVALALDDGAALRVEIEDDGVGLPAEPRAGVGLQSMRDRALELDGELRVEAVSGGGTRIVAEIPLVEAGHLEAAA